MVPTTRANIPDVFLLTGACLFGEGRLSNNQIPLKANMQIWPEPGAITAQQNYHRASHIHSGYYCADPDTQTEA